MSSHKGEILKRVLDERGVSITWLAEKINKTPRSLYNWFENPFVSIDKFIEIGKVINYDFSNDLPELSSIVSEPGAHYSKSILTSEEANARYFNLLDKYTRLLEDYKNVSDELRILKYKYQSP